MGVTFRPTETSTRTHGTADADPPVGTGSTTGTEGTAATEGPTSTRRTEAPTDTVVHEGPGTGGDAGRARTDGTAGLRPPSTARTSAEVATEIRNSPAYTNATPEQRAQLDAVLSRIESGGNIDDMRAFQRVLASPFWSAADAAAKGEMLSLMEQIPLSDVDHRASNREQGRGVTRPSVALAEMAERQLNGRPMLLDQAHGGGTLIHHLADGAQRLGALPSDHPMLSQCGCTAAEIMGGLILETNDSGRIAQSNVGSCTMTTSDIMLIEQNPAERTRLAVGLMVDGRVTMRGGGTLERDTSSIPPTPGNSRTPSERIFQSALMEYASGADYQIRSDSAGKVTDVHAGNVLDTLPLWLQILSWLLLLPGLIMTLWPYDQGGVSAWQINHVNSDLFGEDWNARYSGAAGWGLGLADANFIPHSGSGNVDWLMERSGGTGDFSNDRVAVCMSWAPAGQHGYHYLKLEHVDPPGTDPRLVHMHNPWGSDPYAAVGSEVDNGAPAGVRWVDPERGIVSMPVSDFQDRLLHMNYAEQRSNS